jgi:hypothetical protein
MSDAEVEAKFLDLASRRLGVAGAEKALRGLWTFDRCSHVAETLALIYAD